MGTQPQGTRIVFDDLTRWLMSTALPVTPASPVTAGRSSVRLPSKVIRPRFVPDEFFGHVTLGRQHDGVDVCHAFIKRKTLDRLGLLTR